LLLVPRSPNLPYAAFDIIETAGQDQPNAEEPEGKCGTMEGGEILERSNSQRTHYIPEELDRNFESMEEDEKSQYSNTHYTPEEPEGSIEPIEEDKILQVQMPPQQRSPSTLSHESSVPTAHAMATHTTSTQAAKKPRHGAVQKVRTSWQ
jgi:hypothetical protein